MNRTWLTQHARVAALVLLTLSSTVNASSLVPLVQIKATQSHLIVTTISHGCTQKSDFQLTAKTGPLLVLSVQRIRHDHCRARARPFSVSLAFDTLPKAIATRLERGESFRLDNMIVPITPSFLKKKRKDAP
ncbi:Uncharacterised protein [BD1-7 clade bacterium]|uniref:Uncharacterized protein n=1 Tax=BD1-7 clade bacterium TaxID=2029982 RepID=A0A5S9Q6I1_9GAMM|nr:Uncharacterised protein [BD1-7 clade bacterium]CAA0112848.1 Uncharacterised protein [BD1-7 clade bacterium]